MALASSHPPKTNVLAEIGTIFGWATVAVAYTFGSSWFDDLSSTTKLTLLFLWLFPTMLWLSFRAVHHAEALAELIGEPIGTIVLTLSVICIEVALVTMVSLTGNGTPTLARDTMFAVVMIVLAGMVGISLLVGGIKHHEQQYDLRGAAAYLSVLVPMAVLGLIMPRVSSAPGGRVSALEGTFLAITSASLYVVFLAMQTRRHREYFAEPASTQAAAPAHHATFSTWVHAALLLGSLLPIVILSKKLAVLVDYGVAALNAPAALGGVVVAALVLTPEGVAALRATIANQLQRTVNLLFGAALSTIGLTIPAVLIVQWLSGRPITLGLEAPQAILLALTLVMCIIHFGGRRTTVLQGAVHLVLFMAYLILIFD